MKAMVLKELCAIDENHAPLVLMDIPEPTPGDNDILVRITACGVCHTELDEIEGRTPPPRLPVVPGHQVVGVVEETALGGSQFESGDRVGIAWVYSACGNCKYCLTGNENLCHEFEATGRDRDGGYAEFIAVPEKFAYRIPDEFSDTEAAPLLCAGAIGYRSLRLADLEDGQKLGLTGFGASAHLVLKMVRHKYPYTDVYVFARSKTEREFALELGAVWTGDTADRAPDKLDSIIDTTPAWKPIVEALDNLDAGGRLVINAIRKEGGDKTELARIDYARHLWMEKEIKSVANVSRRDVIEFLELAAEIPLKPDIETFALDDANRALVELKQRKIRGAKVLTI